MATNLPTRTIDLSQWAPLPDGSIHGLNKPGTVVSTGYISYPTEIRLDSFENANPLVNPGATEIYEQYLWGQYPNGELIDISHKDNGTLSYNTADFLEGSRSLQLDMEQSPNGDNGSPYLQFYPYYNGRWYYAREAMADHLGITGWQTNTYNRLRFNVKPPAGSLNPATGGQTNFTLGTYYSAPSAGGPTSGGSGAERGGGHFYHYFNLREGVWNQCFMDQHPSHSRGANGGMEQGDRTYPVAADAGTYNYMDMLTRLYFDIGEGYTTTAAPSYLFDDFMFFRQEGTQDEDNIYSISGTYRPSDNRLTLDWNRNKDDNGIAHEVYYSFSDIAVDGLASATLAPNGTVNPPGYQGYNLMAWQTTAIDVTGHNAIYFAIRKTGNLTFKTVRLRLDLDA